MKLWHYALIVFLGGCCYGILSTFVKLAYNAGFSTPEVTGAQYFFGAVLSWIFVIFVKKRSLTLKQITKLLLSGIPFGLTGMFYYQSLQSINASLAIVLLFQFVWIGTLYEWVLQKKKPTGGKLISIGVLLFGSLLAANVSSQGNLSLSWKGTIWGLLGCFNFRFIYFPQWFCCERYFARIEKRPSLNWSCYYCLCGFPSNLLIQPGCAGRIESIWISSRSFWRCIASTSVLHRYAPYRFRNGYNYDRI